jgi:hypothetical protein
MAQTNINILMDEDLKRDFDALCGEAVADTPESMAGILHGYANPALVPYESDAWGIAVKEKYAADRR